MPYLEAPRWAKYTLNTLYSLFYGYVLLFAIVFALGDSPLWSIIAASLASLGAAACIIAIWSRNTEVEWSASWFVIGGFFSFLLIQWYAVLTEANNASISTILNASIGLGGLILLLARSVLLFIAVQKNKAYSRYKE